MVDGVAPMAQKISPEFIGLILIPIIKNAAEHVTAVTVAIKDKRGLPIGVAVGSSMQIALLVLPLIVIIGWIANIDAMTLEFDGFLLLVVFVSVLLVNYLICDGRSHWLESVMLLALYIIIATAAYLYPADPSEVDRAASYDSLIDSQNLGTGQILLRGHARRFRMSRYSSDDDNRRRAATAELFREAAEVFDTNIYLPTYHTPRTQHYLR